jgi:hypothetical protein
MLQPVEVLADSAVYRIEESGSGTVDRFVVSTPETRAICNDPLVMGVDYTRRLKGACTRILTRLDRLHQLRLAELETIGFEILRGGLNFGLREALADAFGWNRHGSSFISAQRARVSDSPEDWHIIESDYSKVYMPPIASIVIGDVVATGTSLEHAIHALVNEAVKQGARLRSVVFFTIGGPRAEEILSRADQICRWHFSAYERTTVIYLEGRFSVPTTDSPLRIKITGTDLLRRDALLTPEFVESQYEAPAHPIQRCAIYDAGSRAFWVPEYLEDLVDYWRQTLDLAHSGVTYPELLAERCPVVAAERFPEADLVGVCRDQLALLEG